MTRAALTLLLLLAAPARATEADVLGAARDALAGVWPDAEVSAVRLSLAASAAAPPLRVRFRDAAPRGRVSAEVEAQGADGAWTAAGWAILSVAVFETAPVLVESVARGAPVEAAVAWRRTETTSLHDAPLARTDLAGWTATRTLRAGDVLTARLVEAPPAVERGEALRVRYRRGAIAVSLECQSRERGAVGETVRAYCAETRALYRVALVAPGEGDWAATL